MGSETREWTLDEVRKAISSDSLKRTRVETGRTLPSLYTMRNNYRRFLSGKRKFSPWLIQTFTQLQKENVNITQIVHFNRSVLPIEVTPLDSATIDPYTELEIAIDTLKKRITQLIPLMVSQVMTTRLKRELQSIENMARMESGRATKKSIGAALKKKMDILKGGE